MDHGNGQCYPPHTPFGRAESRSPRWRSNRGSRIVDFGQSSTMRRSADAGISSTTCIAVASLTMPQARDQITDQHGALASLDRCVSDREISPAHPGPHSHQRLF
jgi:hypothetical protein